jgi:hypothetical protein
MPDDDYLERLEEARELIQLAGETEEGRAAARSWLRQVISAVGDAEPVVLQPVPPGLAGSGYIANRDAMRRSGYDATTVALSETGGAGIELYPDVPGAGLYLAEAAGDGGTMQDDFGALHQAAAQDEIDRYALMLQGRRPGPARPQYAGLQLSEPWPLEEVDEDDLIQATMQLAGITEGGATFRDVAEAVDELALSRTPETPRETASRADALVRLAGMFPARTPAAGELDLELARQREIERISREHLGRGRASDRIARRQGAVPDEAEDAREEVDSIVERHRDMLSHAPRQGRTHLSSDADYDKFGPQNDGGQPARGGVMHPEVERLAREHGLLVGWSPNTTYPVLTPRERERAERRARPGHQSGLFTIPEMEARRRRGQRSAFSSRG